MLMHQLWRVLGFHEGSWLWPPRSDQGRHDATTDSDGVQLEVYLSSTFASRDLEAEELHRLLRLYILASQAHSYEDLIVLDFQKWKIAFNCKRR